jgi:hypothetical protein
LVIIGGNKNRLSSRERSLLEEGKMKPRRSASSLRVLGAVLIVLAGICFFGRAAGQEPPPAERKPVDVDVRVFDDNRFVDTLSLGDFELFENGVRQQPASLFLVKGQTVVRKEETGSVLPAVERSFYLLFQTVDWDPMLGNTVDYLFSSVLRPGDRMTMVTPVKPYNLQKDALATKPMATLSKSMQDLLRKDIQRGGGEYRDIIKTLRRITNAIEGTRLSVEEDLATDTSASDFGLELQLDQYRNALMKMESLRLVDERKLLEFAAAVRVHPGVKYLYFFYEREYRPEISPMAMQTLLSLYQDNPTIQANLMDLFQYYRRETTFNADRVKKAFADAGIVLNFIFMDKKSQRLFGGTMHEQSEDIFPGFRAIALATGGVSEISQNPAAAFKAAAVAAEDYYLLTYTPAEPASAGEFRTIEVKIARKDPSGRDYTVTNRLGYYAR